MSDSGKIWITWEKQRRSVELAKALGCELYVFDYEGRSRYPRCIYNTLKVLLSSKDKIVFVQNPSMILAATACLYGLIFRSKVVVDRHTTFRLRRRRKFFLDWLIFVSLHHFTLRYADLTIVTNKYLADIVQNKGGNALVLPDKLPDLHPTQNIKLGEGYNIFMISSFGSDEPISEAIHAAERMKEDGLSLFISGNTDKVDKSVMQTAPENVYFTNFLSDESFVNHIYAADAVMVLTTNDNCMLCGCYEAIAAKKPLITSNKQVLRDYFAGSVFVENTSEEIFKGLRELMNSHSLYKKKSLLLKQKIEREWPEKYKELEKYVSTPHQ